MDEGAAATRIHAGIHQRDQHAVATVLLLMMHTRGAGRQADCSSGRGVRWSDTSTLGDCTGNCSPRRLAQGADGHALLHCARDLPADGSDDVAAFTSTKMCSARGIAGG
jgi:hypothetical protein